MGPRNAVQENLNALATFVRTAWQRFDEERCLELAASLTYTTLLALVPLITVALAVATTFPVFGEWTGQLDGWLAKNVLPPQIAGAITAYVREFSAAAAKLTALGIAFVVVTAGMLMYTIDRGLNQIFRITRARPLAQQLLMYWVVLTLGPALLGASISITSVLVSTSLGFAGELPLLRFEVLRVASLLLTTAAITLVYLIVPYRKVHARHAMIGGIVAGLGFELMQGGFALYIARFPTYTLVYGAFAAVPIFLLWLYLSWVVVLFGAAVTAALPGHRRGELRGRAPGQQFYEALEVLGSLAEAQRHGRMLPLAQLVRDVHLAPDQCERMLDRMERLGWTARAAGEGWMLARGADTLRVVDVYQTFVMDAAPLHMHSGAPIRALHELLTGPQSGLEASMQMPLSELFAELPVAEEPLRRNRVFELLGSSRAQK